MLIKILAGILNGSPVKLVDFFAVVVVLVLALVLLFRLFSVSFGYGRANECASQR